MGVDDIAPIPGLQLKKIPASASPDMLREMIRGFTQRMMGAEVEVRCGAGYGEVSPDRVNSWNGYQQRQPCPVRSCQSQMSPRSLAQGERELTAQHEVISAFFHHDSRRDSLSSDTARETIRKISLKPIS